jgi:protein-S-isoprenylcysteine O-methyltransferase Ste14
MTSLPSLGRRGEGWVAIQMVLLALTGLAGFLGPVWTGEIRLFTVALGATLMTGGLILVVLGIRDLREAVTPLPYPRDDAELVQTGVYGLVRHPIYGGLVIGSIGWGFMTASPVALAMAVFLLAFFEMKSRREEAWLEARFPEYSTYRARTRRLIPWPGGGRG